MADTLFATRLTGMTTRLFITMGNGAGMMSNDISASACWPKAGARFLLARRVESLSGE
jgi:hypothetical protein